MSSKRKYITVEVWQQGSSASATYSGRCLGLLTDKQYAGLLERPELMNRIMTVETTPVRDIGVLDNIEGTRLAMSLKSKDGKDIFKKKLFISEPIEHVSQMNALEEITITGKNGSFMFITEESIDESS